MEMSQYARYFDHTLLKQTATQAEVEKLCAEAATHQFFSVCVNPYWVPLCKMILKNTSVKVCTVVGFPLGANSVRTKIEEASQCLDAGAEEIDFVMNVGALKSCHLPTINEELTGIVTLCRGKALVKVIVESGMLSSEELMTAIHIVNESGAEFIKTSTGFAATGATPEAVNLMKLLGRPGLQIKASGGIRTAHDFRTYVSLGATRVGASRSIEIINELENQK